MSLPARWRGNAKGAEDAEKGKFTTQRRQDAKW